MFILRGVIKVAKILAVDDDQDILVLIKNILQREQHYVCTQDRVANLPLEFFGGYDLILLDVMMKDMSGFDLCRKIRHVVDCPILFVTAKANEEDLVKGLMMGGDDYITKPFSIQELSARVYAHLRRENRDQYISKRIISGVTFDLNTKEVSIEGRKLSLTKTEYLICEFLARHKGRVFTREEIYDAVYGIDGNALCSTVTEFIRTIRYKFKEHEMVPIKTIWGVGYKWE